MSEKLNNHKEFDPAQPEHPSQHHEALKPAHEKQEKTKAEMLDAKKTREQINKIHETHVDNHTETNASDDSGVVRPHIEKASVVLAENLRRVRHRLTPGEKRFSKVIHNPVVSTVSEATAKSLARPYAMLSGGIVACVGSAIYMYYTRHLGYKYNFFVPIFLFVVGLGIGLLVEIIYKALTSRHKTRM